MRGRAGLTPRSMLVVVAGLLSFIVLLVASGPSRADEDTSRQIEHIQQLIDRARYREADSLAGSLLVEVEGAHGSESLEAAQVLDLIVEARLWGGRPKDSETRRFAQRAADIRETLLGQDHPDVAMGLWHLGYYLMAGGDYDGASEVLKRALMIAESAVRPEHPDVARIVALQGRVLDGMGQFAKAQECFERALLIQEETVGSYHKDTARTLAWLSWHWIFVRDNQEAIAAGERALEIHQKISGPNSHHTARAMNTLAASLVAAGQVDRAWDMYQQAYTIYQEVLDPDHTDIGYVLFNLGEIKSIRGELDESSAYYEEGLSIIEKAYGPEYEDVAYGLINLGEIQRQRGDYAGARSLIERAIAIYERTLGASNPRMAVTRQRLALVLADMGEYAEARKMLEHALSTLEDTHGPDNAAAASCRSSLAGLKSRVGDYAGGRAGMEQALAVYEKVYGPGHAATGYIHQNLGWILYRMGDMDLARKSFERTIAIHEKTLGREHMAVAQDLTGLGVVLTHAGDYEQAGALLERALAIMEEVEGPEGPNTAMCLHNLAILRRNVGDPEGAERIYERAIPIVEKLYGLDHPNRARLLYNYAVLLAGTGRPAEALEAALEAEEISSRHVRLTSRRFAEHEALRYAAVGIEGLDLILTLAATIEDPGATTRAWDALIRSRALVLDEIAARHRTVTGISRLAQDLIIANERLANLMVRGAESDSPERYQRLVEEARNHKDRAERALAERSVGFREGQRASKATLLDVVAGLPLRSALISFSRYDRHESDPAGAHSPGHRPVVTPSYLALIQGRDAAEPVVIDLGAADEIDALISEFRRELEPAPVMVEASCRVAGANLRSRIWDPVTSHLEGIEKAFIVPDGALNLVSLATLPVERSLYLLDTGPVIHYVSAERDLVPSHMQLTEGQGLLILGGPDYGADVEVAALGSGLLGSTGHRGSAIPFRGQRSGCSDFADLRFSPLAGAAMEASEIAALWESTPGAGRVLHASGAEAAEVLFKTESPGKRVLHLATHGFFLGNCASALDGHSSFEGLVPTRHLPPSIRGENPLILAGLAFASANRRASAGPDVEDGILTAQEIGALDLSGVEVAVLSACGTGVGEVRAGEGVFGLRRAFQVAGARTLVMSLWSVDDQATREWMRAFYQGWLVEGLSKAEAVSGASLSVLRSRRDKGGSTHPFYWGAFVAAGDWR